MGDRPIPQTPFEVISSDHIVALPETAAGSTALLVHIDHATRYVLARATNSLGAHAITESLEDDIITRFGPPALYISDNGPGFTAKHTKRFLAK